MAARLHLATSGNMTVRLFGVAINKHLHDPAHNVKSYIVEPHEIIFNAADQNDFTDWAVLELVDESPGLGFIEVTVDSPTLGWYGTAQVAVVVNGQVVMNDNFQSGVRGPLGDPRKTKRYKLLNFQ